MNSHKKITKSDLGLASITAIKYLRTLRPTLYYHGISHTNNVVKYSKKLSNKQNYTGTQFSKKDLKKLIEIAAWFHDTGFESKYDSNEIIGAEFAKKFMLQEGYSDKQIKIVVDAIKLTNLATYSLDMPLDKEIATAAAILRDADLSYIGFKLSNFIEWMNKYRFECLKDTNAKEHFKKLSGNSNLHEIAKEELKWYKSSYNFYTKFHKWFSEGGSKLFKLNKDKNIVWLENEIIRLEKNNLI